MTERKSILLRLDPAVHDALARWASDELRSTNAQIEFLLRRSLADAGGCPAGPDRCGPAGGRLPPAAPEPACHRRGMTSPGDVMAWMRAGQLCASASAQCPRVGVARRGGRGNGQEIAAFTSSITLFSAVGLHFLSAYATGQISPSSRFAASWKPRVE